MTDGDTPDFGFAVSIGYQWLIERGLVGFEADTSLQPWHYLPRSEAFDLRERWPAGPGTASLFAFARREDNDDFACFEVIDGRAERIALVHRWTNDGFDITGNYRSFWEWLKSVVDEIAEWLEPE